ncbi:DUF859 family phage minor structural protein [Enterococcus casseliflavus]|uniref:DUF859 family phage minor structural protein n=1 Tax=Enterococcus casseliflavus TaxID=37734 RepID=UPI0030195B84
MALSGSNESNFTNNSALKLILEWSANQNIANNTSTVTANLYLKGNYSYSTVQTGSVQKAVSITINGNKKSSTSRIDITATEKRLLMSHSVTINHNSDGTKSFSLSGILDAQITWHGGWVSSASVSGSHTLNTIPRASSMSVTPSTQVYGSKVTFKITRASSSFTHTIRYNFNGNLGTIVSKTTATSYDWTVPTNFMNYIPNATSTYGTIYVDTYSGNTKVGEKNIRLNTNIPTNIVPSISSITIAESNTAVTSVLGAQSGTGGTYLQSLSRIKFTVNGASGANGSTISSTKISFNGSSWNGTTATTGAINKSGAITVTATVTDSRGRSKSLSANVTLTAYSPPALTVASVTRNDKGFGTTLSVRRTGTFTQIASKNRIKLFFEYKPNATATTWIGYTALSKNPATDTNGTFNYTENTSTSVYTFLTTQAYPVRIIATDLFGESSIWTGTLNTAEVAMSLGKKGVGIGKILERGVLDVEGVSYFNGDINIGANGRLKLAPDLYASLGGGIDFNNSDLVGINGLWIGATRGGADPANNDGEGLLFPHSNTVIPESGIISSRDGWDNFRIMDGIGYLNGKPVMLDTSSSIWSGIFYMNANDVVTPTVKLSDCPNGWMLLWSDYDADTSKANDFDWHYSVIHKTFSSGGQIRMQVPNYDDSFANKAIYCTGTQLKGHSINDATGAGKDVVLRKVLAF